MTFQSRVAERAGVARQIADQNERVSFAYIAYARKIIEVFGSLLVVGRVVGPCLPERTSEMEEAMANSVRFKEIDDLVESNLNQLLANPELAEEAFPDPQLRENIIPLFRSMRRKAEELENEVSKR